MPALCMLAAKCMLPCANGSASVCLCALGPSRHVKVEAAFAPDVALAPDAAPALYQAAGRPQQSGLKIVLVGRSRSNIR